LGDGRPNRGGNVYIPLETKADNFIDDLPDQIICTINQNTTNRVVTDPNCLFSRTSSKVFSKTFQTFYAILFLNYSNNQRVTNSKEPA